MRRITLDGFAAKFVANDDPWSTLTDWDEALKRRASTMHAPAATVLAVILNSALL